MTKILDGSELAGYIKERQARQVRGLRQAWHVNPKLVIIKSEGASPVIDAYVRLKKRYSEDVLVETEVETLALDTMPEAIARLNADPTVHGIIIQLPLDDLARTDEIVNLVAPEKDVDGLNSRSNFDSASATAINWLLAGYGISLQGKNIAIVGNGRLVGAPLARIWQSSGYNVTVYDKSSADIKEGLRSSQVIVSATGVPHLITSAMVGLDTVVVDAGTASEDGVIVGDIDDTLRSREDVTITPAKGGVGPLTVCALFDNVITAARATTTQEPL